MPKKRDASQSVRKPAAGRLLNTQPNPIISETNRRNDAMRLTTSLLLTVLLIGVGGHACAGGTSTTKGRSQEHDESRPTRSPNAPRPL